jgi:8-oxo-dGTP pyrophosphatase MutT (NUDIX family)
MSSDSVFWRERLLEELERYQPADERERAMVASLRAFVAAEPACFERSHPSGHVTASAWVVDRARRVALLTHHRKLDRWLQLGGHADGEGDLRSVALREAREESGLEAFEFALREIYDVDVHEIPARGDEPMHLHYDVRFALYARDETPRASAESFAVAWVPLAGLAALGADASVRRLAAKTVGLGDAG